MMSNTIIVQEFKLRAEAPADIAAMLQLINIVFMEYYYDQVYFGVEVTFESQWPLDKIKKALAAIPDSHVMLDTINYAHKYTGNR